MRYLAHARTAIGLGAVGLIGMLAMAPPVVTPALAAAAEPLVAYVDANSMVTINSETGTSPVEIARGWSPAWNKAHTVLYYASECVGVGSKNECIFSYTVKTKAIKQLLSNANAVYGISGIEFNATTRKLAFMESENDTNPLTIDLYTMSAGGGKPTRLTTTGGNRKSPEAHWSPDGTKLLFEDAAGFYVVNANGTDLTLLPITPNDVLEAYDPWSPDSTSFVFTAQNSTYNGTLLNTYDVLTGATSTLYSLASTSGYGMLAPTWSADGTKVAFTEADTTTSQVVTIGTAAGSQPVVVQSFPNPQTTETWSPNGTMLLVTYSQGSCCTSNVVASVADVANATPTTVQAASPYTGQAVWRSE
jgi:Tol biopolymer transport system component